MHKVFYLSKVFNKIFGSYNFFKASYDSLFVCIQSLFSICSFVSFSCSHFFIIPFWSVYSWILIIWHKIETYLSFNLSTLFSHVCDDHYNWILGMFIINYRKQSWNLIICGKKIRERHPEENGEYVGFQNSNFSLSILPFFIHFLIFKLILQH